MKMKKLLATALALLMSMMACVPVFAASHTGTIDCISSIGDQSGDGWNWDAESKTLTVTDDLLIAINRTSNSEKYYGIKLPAGATLDIQKSLLIKFGAEDLSQAGFGHAVYAEGDITIKGKLDVSKYNGGDFYAVSSLGKVTLNNAQIKAAWGIGINTDSLEVQGDNSVTSDFWALYHEGKIALTGDGSLVLTAGDTPIHCNNYDVDGSLELSIVSPETGVTPVLYRVELETSADGLSLAKNTAQNRIEVGFSSKEAFDAMVRDQQEGDEGMITFKIAAPTDRKYTTYSASIPTDDRPVEHFSVNEGTIQLGVQCSETKSNQWTFLEGRLIEVDITWESAEGNVTEKLPIYVKPYNEDNLLSISNVKVDYCGLSVTDKSVNGQVNATVAKNDNAAWQKAYQNYGVDNSVAAKVTVSFDPNELTDVSNIRWYDRRNDGGESNSGDPIEFRCIIADTLTVSGNEFLLPEDFLKTYYFDFYGANGELLYQKILHVCIYQAEQGQALALPNAVPEDSRIVLNPGNYEGMDCSYDSGTATFKLKDSEKLLENVNKDIVIRVFAPEGAAKVVLDEEAPQTLDSDGASLYFDINVPYTKGDSETELIDYKITDKIRLTWLTEDDEELSSEMITRVLVPISMEGTWVDFIAEPVPDERIGISTYSPVKSEDFDGSSSKLTISDGFLTVEYDENNLPSKELLEKQELSPKIEPPEYAASFKWLSINDFSQYGADYAKEQLELVLNSQEFPSSVGTGVCLELCKKVTVDGITVYLSNAREYGVLFAWYDDMGDLMSCEYLCLAINNLMYKTEFEEIQSEPAENSNAPYLVGSYDNAEGYMLKTEIPAQETDGNGVYYLIDCVNKQGEKVPLSDLTATGNESAAHTIYLNYPEGMTYELSIAQETVFTVHHYSDETHTEFETLMAEATPYGLRIEVSHLSPIIVSYKSSGITPNPGEKPDSDNTGSLGSTGSGIEVVAPNNGSVGEDGTSIAPPQTGDSQGYFLLPCAAFMFAAAVILIAAYKGKSESN